MLTNHVLNVTSLIEDAHIFFMVRYKEDVGNPRRFWFARGNLRNDFILHGLKSNGIGDHEIVGSDAATSDEVGGLLMLVNLLRFGNKKKLDRQRSAVEAFHWYRDPRIEVRFLLDPNRGSIKKKVMFSIPSESSCSATYRK